MRNGILHGMKISAKIGREKGWNFQPANVTKGRNQMKSTITLKIYHSKRQDLLTGYIKASSGIIVRVPQSGVQVMHAGIPACSSLVRAFT